MLVDHDQIPVELSTLGLMDPSKGQVVVKHSTPTILLQKLPATWRTSGPCRSC